MKVGPLSHLWSEVRGEIRCPSATCAEDAPRVKDALAAGIPRGAQHVGRAGGGEGAGGGEIAEVVERVAAGVLRAS